MTPDQIEHLFNSYQGRMSKEAAATLTLAVIVGQLVMSMKESDRKVEDKQDQILDLLKVNAMGNL